MSGLKKHKFAKVKVEQPATLTDVEGAAAESLAAFVAQKVAGDPRGAPLTLPAGIVPLPLGNPTPLAEDAGETPIAAPLAAELATALERSFAPVPYIALDPCGLDDACKNSNITVVSNENKPYPVLMTPAGELPLAHSDVARKLPIGAYILRIAPTVGRFRRIGGSLQNPNGTMVPIEDGMEFVAEQLDAAVGRPKLYTKTAREAVRQFGKHFHDHKD